STANHYSGTWFTTTTAAASGGTLHSTYAAGASVSQTFTGSGIAWVAYRGPTRGKARVYIDGVLITTVDLYASTGRGKVVVFDRSWATSATHTIRVVGLGTAGRSRIDLDGFTRLVLS